MDSTSVSTSENTSSSEYSSVRVDKTLEEIYSELLEKVKTFSLTIDEYLTIEQNNPIPPSDADDSTLIMNYRKNIVDGLIAQLKEAEPKDFTHQYIEVLTDLIADLMIDLKDMDTIVAISEDKLAAAEKEVTTLEKQIETLKIIASKRNEEWEIQQDKEIDEMSKVLEVLFARYRKWLHETIAEVFPRDKDAMQDLLADLCAAYFSNSEDSYVDIPHHSLYRHIELLLTSNIIVRHPYNKEKIKLVSFS